MKVIAFPRTEQGSGASRRLRRAGHTPGIIYGGPAAPVAITLDHNALYHALKKEAFHSSIPIEPASAATLAAALRAQLAAHCPLLVGVFVNETKAELQAI